MKIKLLLSASFIVCISSFISLHAKDKTFIYCSEGSPSSFNPQLATDGTTFNATIPVYDKLVDFKVGTTLVEPSLAKEKPKISVDGLTYTFYLRNDVHWHTTKYFKPTRNFNADDVLFTFDRQRKKDHPYHLVNGGTYEYFNSMGMGELIKDIIKVDDYTVKFILTKPEAPFLANLAMDFASILSKEYGDYLIKIGKKEHIDTEPIGTGPFIFKRYTKDTIIRYEVNKDYFEGRSPFDQLVFSITPDASVRYQKLKVGECHFAAYPSPTDLNAIKKDKNLRVMEQEGLNVGYLAMNVDKKPFDNRLIRQAINHALDKKSYITAIYLGNARVAKNPIPPSMWSYNDEIKDYEYNPERAKKLLKEAGYPKGFETKLWVLPVSRPYNPQGKKMGEMMQSDLAKIGIKATLVQYDWPTYLEKSKNGEHELLQMGWTGDNGDPDNFLYTNLSCDAKTGGANRARWCNTQFDEKLIAAKKTDKLDKRIVEYKEAQKIFHDEAPWVTLAHSKVSVAMSNKVVGYKIDPFGRDRFYGVDLQE